MRRIIFRGKITRPLPLARPTEEKDHMNYEQEQAAHRELIAVLDRMRARHMCPPCRIGAHDQHQLEVMDHQPCTCPRCGPALA